MELETQQPTPSCEHLGKGSQASDALEDTKFPNPSLLLRVLYLLRLYRFPLLYGYVLEFRSLLWRIVRLHRTQLYRTSLDIGPAFEKTLDGPFQECIRTRACSEDIRNLYATNPGLTVLDVQLFLDGWKLGWASANGNADTERPHESSAS